MIIILCLALYFSVMNLATFLLYWIDKEQAKLHGWRVSENALLLMGFAGGSIGGFLAQRTLRHKTRKAPFQQAFWLIVTLQIAVVVFLAVFLIA